MARQDEIEALLVMIDRIYEGDSMRLKLAPTPEEIKAFLRTRPNWARLNAALLAILARMKAYERAYPEKAGL